MYETGKDMNTPLAYAQLQKHVFVQEAFQDAWPIHQKTYVPGTVSKVDAPYKRSLYKNEFYIIRVGHALTHLLITCEQLSHAPLYLTSFCPSKKMVATGVTRHSHVLFCIENYIIRTRSLYDRMLQVVNVVFSLYNPPDQVTHVLIKNNFHLTNTKVPSALQKLRKITDKHHEDRNRIVHRECFQEDDLRFIELLTISKDKHPELEADLKSETRAYVSKKAQDMLRGNSEAFAAVNGIFDLLLHQYRKQKAEDVKIYGDIDPAESSS
jgi:hypothetical protein